MTVRLPYETESDPIASATISTAHAAGWTWNIGLPERKGIGYVFSSQHCTEQEASETLQSYVGTDLSKQDVKLLKLQLGYREEQWVNNCVAVGLFGGFLEPLESTGIAMIEAAAHLLADYFPRRGDLDSVSRLFNRAMRERFECAVEFIKLHFYLTKRRDTDFWRDNANPGSAPDGLLEKIERWKYRTPTKYDLETVYESFQYFNYQYILYGMECYPDLSDNLAAYPFRKQALEEFRQVQSASRRAVQALPDHRQLIQDIYAKGFV